MDPNATLRAILANTGGYPFTDEFDQAIEHCEALAQWLRRGGFAPTVPAGSKYWPGTNTPYAILSPMDDTNYKWLFVVYDTRGERMESWTLETEEE